MPDQTSTEKLIKSTGCSDIQDAIKAVEKAGYSIRDLDTKALDTVVKTMASASSVGAQAGPKQK